MCGARSPGSAPTRGSSGSSRGRPISSTGCWTRSWLSSRARPTILDNGPMTDVHFVKGHGTENDFVLVPDLEAIHPLTPEQVVRLADRRSGIGGDGVIRIAPTESSSDDFVRQQASSATFFMDYRNADGSVAEMCGNGVRVIAAYLREQGLETADTFSVATRGGI